MPGPAPKPLAYRQRRNKAVTRANLPAQPKTKQAIPRLPQLPQKSKWLPVTKKWWRDVWTSPMASEYLQADMHALMRLAVLVNLFWTEPSTNLAAEIRLQQQAFGLTPLDRRRLEWNIEQVETAREKRDRRRSKQAKIINGNDPRDILK